MLDEPVGADLAKAVAGQLERGYNLVNGHRDYCGMGLRFHEGRYHYGEVHDDLLPVAGETPAGKIVGNTPHQVFASRPAFVNWLAGQTDRSLSGEELDSFLHNNQRLTIERLRRFIGFVS